MQLHSVTNYTNDRYDFLKNLEGEKAFAYADSKGIATIGVGINLRVHFQLLFSYLGIDRNGVVLSGPALAAEQNYIRQLQSAIFREYAPDNGDQNAVRQTLNSIMARRAADTAYSAFSSFERVPSFEYQSSGDSKGHFDLVMDGYPGFTNNYERQLDSWLSQNQIAPISQSTERLTLISLTFNNAGVLLGPKLAGALNADDRAEAWFQIRFGSNGGASRNQGIANRRYKESDRFELFDDGNSVSEADAKQALRTYTRHFGDIAAYETTFSPTHPNANSRRAEEIVAPADSILISLYAQGIGPTIDAGGSHVLVGNDQTVRHIARSTGRVVAVFNANDSGDTSLIGTAQNDLILGEGGNDELIGQSGDDVLLGGLGRDTLKGDTGTDYYVFQTGDGTDTINDADALGRVVIGTLPARIGTTNKGNKNVWKDDQGFVYTFRGTDIKQDGTLEITGGTLAAGDQIKIENFKLADANAEYLGIKLNPEQEVAVSKGINTGFFNAVGAVASAFSTTLGEELAQTFTVSLRNALAEGQKLIAKVTGLDGNLFAVRGDDIVPFTNGEVELTLAPGQTEVTFSVIEKGDIDTDQAIELTATVEDPNAAPVQSNVVTLNVDAVEENTAPVTTRTIVGDLAPIDFEPGTPGIQTRLDDLGNVITDPAQPEPDRADFLNDSAGNDRIESGGGVDTITAFAGGDDHILSGTGDDGVSAGAGNDVVEAGPGSDNVIGDLGDDRLFADALTPFEDAVANGDVADGAARGDLLAGNEGGDTVVGGAERDFLTGGAGDDRIAGGGGDDIIESDVDLLATQTNWAVTLQVADTTYTVAHQNMTLGTEGAGADVVHAGGGDDYVSAGAGGDTVFGERGADVLFGEAGDDTLLGGEGNDVLNGDNGAEFLAEAFHRGDFLDGGAGDDTLFGMGSSDALFGGEGNDQLFDESADTPVAAAGDDYIDGEDRKYGADCLRKRCAPLPSRPPLPQRRQPVPTTRRRSCQVFLTRQRVA